MVLLISALNKLQEEEDGETIDPNVLVHVRCFKIRHHLHIPRLFNTKYVVFPIFCTFQAFVIRPTKKNSKIDFTYKHTKIFLPRTESKTMANFVDYKHLPACTLYIHMKLSIVARLHVLHAHGCVSEQLHSVLSSASLSSALLSLPSTCWRLWMLPCHPLFS